MTKAVCRPLCSFLSFIVHIWVAGAVFFWIIFWYALQWMVKLTQKLNMKRLEKIWKITTVSQCSSGNESTDRSMQLLSSSGQAAERLITSLNVLLWVQWHSKTYCCSFINKHKQCQHINIIWARDSWQGSAWSWHCTFTARTPNSVFNFCHCRSCQFLPMSFILLTLSAITLLFISNHLFQLQLNLWR